MESHENICMSQLLYQRGHYIGGLVYYFSVLFKYFYFQRSQDADQNYLSIKKLDIILSKYILYYYKDYVSQKINIFRKTESYSLSLYVILW